MIVVNAKHTWLPQHPTVGELVVHPEGGTRRPYFNNTMVQVSDSLGSADIVAGTTAVVVFSMSDISSALEKSGGGRSSSSSHADDGCTKPPQTKRGLEQKIHRVLQRDGVSGGGASTSSSHIWSTTRLLFLVHSDLPEPPTSAMTWVNMAALDAQAKLMFVWTPREAAAVLEGFQEDTSHYATSGGGGNGSGGGGNAGPFSLLPFGSSASAQNRSVIQGAGSLAEGDGGEVNMTQGTAATINMQGTARPNAHMSGGGTGLNAGLSSPHTTAHPTSKSERASVALAALIEVNGFNRTDAVRLLNNTTTFADILMADVEVELAGKIPELTKKKAARLDAAFNAPFPNTSVSLNDYLVSGGGGMGGVDDALPTVMTPVAPYMATTPVVAGGMPPSNPQQPPGNTTVASPPHQSSRAAVTAAPAASTNQVPTSQNHQPFVFNNPATTAALQAMLDAELSDEDD